MAPSRRRAALPLDQRPRDANGEPLRGHAMAMWTRQQRARGRARGGARGRARGVVQGDRGGEEGNRGGEQGNRGVQENQGPRDNNNNNAGGLNGQNNNNQGLNGQNAGNAGNAGIAGGNPGARAPGAAQPRPRPRVLPGLANLIARLTPQQQQACHNFWLAHLAAPGAPHPQPINDNHQDFLRRHVQHQPDHLVVPPPGFRAAAPDVSAATQRFMYHALNPQVRRVYGEHIASYEQYVVATSLVHRCPAWPVDERVAMEFVSALATGTSWGIRVHESEEIEQAVEALKYRSNVMGLSISGLKGHRLRMVLEGIHWAEYEEV